MACTGLSSQGKELLNSLDMAGTKGWRFWYSWRENTYLMSWDGQSNFTSWGCKWDQVSYLLGTSVVEAAPDHLAPSFEPWQKSLVSRAASQGPCPLGLDDDSSSLEAAPSHLPSQDQACSPAGDMSSASVGIPLLTSSFTLSTPSCCQGKPLWVWAQHTLLVSPPQACQQTGLCCTHRGAQASSRNLSSRKAMFGTPPKRKSEVPGKVIKHSRGKAPTRNPVPWPQDDQHGPPLVSSNAP